MEICGFDPGTDHRKIAPKAIWPFHQPYESRRHLFASLLKISSLFRESLRRTRDEASLANPTPAMLEVMQRISERESNLVNAASAARKRNKR